MTETPSASDAIVDSIGLDTHFHFTDTPYVSNYLGVRWLLRKLGVRHIRDTALLDNWTEHYNNLSQLASEGIHTDIITAINEPISELNAFVAAAPNAVEAIEGPNEYDLNGGPNWAPALVSYTKALYAGVKSSPVLSSLPVVGPSLTAEQSYQAVGNLSQWLDVGNMHNYNGANYPNAWNSIYSSMQFAALTSGTKPIATTETGYEDNPSNPNTVTPAVKARYLMRTILEQWNSQVVRTYLYEFLDEGNQSYGILTNLCQPKPSYVALQNMIAQLQDPGPSFTLQPLNYSLTADPSVHHTLLQRRDGTYRLMLWVATQATDPITPTQTVVITTPTHFGTVVQYEWQDSGALSTIPLTQSNGTITLNVTDRVTELKLQP